MMSKQASGTHDPSVDEFLSKVQDDQRRSDCMAVLELMENLTGQPAVMWGKDKVGFGKFRYQGKTSGGEWFHVGFSPRKNDLSLYLHCELDKQSALLEKLGKHKTGKSCLYVKKLDDIHLPTLKKLITKAYKSPAIAGATIEKID